MYQRLTTPPRESDFATPQETTVRATATNGKREWPPFKPLSPAQTISQYNVNIPVCGDKPIAGMAIT